MKFIVFLSLIPFLFMACDGEGGGSLAFGGMCNVPVNQFCVEYDSDLTAAEAEDACNQQANRIVPSTPIFLPGTSSCTVTELARCVMASEDYVIIYEAGGAWSTLSAGGDCLDLGGQFVSY